MSWDCCSRPNQLGGARLQITQLLSLVVALFLTQLIRRCHNYRDLWKMFFISGEFLGSTDGKEEITNNKQIKTWTKKKTTKKGKTRELEDRRKQEICLIKVFSFVYRFYLHNIYKGMNASNRRKYTYIYHYFFTWARIKSVLTIKNIYLFTQLKMFVRSYSKKL